MQKKHILYATTILLLSILLVAVAAAVISQLATNTNNGNLPPLDIFTYTIDGAAYSDGDTIDWGTMTRGTNTATLVITNTHSSQITAYFLNNTMPQGWTITATNNNTVIQPTAQLTLTVTVTIPSTEPSTSFTWETSVYAEEV